MTTSIHDRPPARGATSLNPDDVTLRVIDADDLDDVARILFDAFAGIHDHHRFARDFPDLEAARAMVGAAFANPGIWGVVAERDGQIVGSNFLDERGQVLGVGPITVDPSVQAGGVGRRLMEAVIERGDGALGIRLLQDSFNAASLALYASLGFEVSEPIALMAGTPESHHESAATVRRMTAADLGECDGLHRAVHGFSRSTELADALGAPALTPTVAVRDGWIVAYAATLSHFAFAHAVADTPSDMAALISGAAAIERAPVSFLLPTRQSELFRWCLRAGLRVVKPMTYMAIGAPVEPDGAWIPTVLS